MQERAERAAIDFSSSDVRTKSKASRQFLAPTRRNHGLSRLARTLPTRVGDYTDNFHLWSPAVHPNKSTQRRLAWKRGARQCLIDYGYPRPFQRIGPVEVPTGANRNLQGLEEIRCDRLNLAARPVDPQVCPG